MGATTRTIGGGDVRPGHTLVGDHGGTSDVFAAEPSSAMPGMIHLTTEHGALFLDPDFTVEVLDTDTPAGDSTDG
jgi:hypothetical protein